VDAVIATQPLHRLPFTVHHRRSFTNDSYHNPHQNDRPANVTAAKHAIKTYVLATFETAGQNSIAHLLLILMRRWNNWHQPLPDSFLCAGGAEGRFLCAGGGEVSLRRGSLIFRPLFFVLRRRESLIFSYRWVLLAVMCRRRTCVCFLAAN
jgi:hypothetical protein